MKVAICVITFRRKDGLSRLLDGLNRLCFKKREPDSIQIVVVENEANGPGQEVCEEKAYELKWPITYGVENRRGISYARNTAIKLAGEVDFVVFIDDDEVPDPYWLDELLFVQQEYDADVVTGPVLPHFMGDIPEWAIKGKFYERPRYPTGYQLNYARTGNVLIRAQVFHGMDTIFDERYAITGGSDTHFFKRLNREGRKMVWADEAMVSEWIPESRINVKWLLQRAYRLGNTDSLVERDLDPSFTTRLKRFAKVCIRLVIGFTLVPFSIFGGRHFFIKVLRYIARTFGMLAGAIGNRYEEYKSTHSV